MVVLGGGAVSYERGTPVQVPRPPIHPGNVRDLLINAFAGGPDPTWISIKVYPKPENLPGTRNPNPEPRNPNATREPETKARNFRPETRNPYSKPESLTRNPKS